MHDTEWTLLQTHATSLLKRALTDDELKKFQTLYHEVVQTNKEINLTRITTLHDFILRHYLDSLTLTPIINQHLPNTFTAIDVGSGAGFPALPLAIVYPQATIVAVESATKKATQIERFTQTLNLKNTQTLPERSELLAQNPAHREKYDLATARALANLAVLAELCLPFVKQNGLFLAMKTKEAEAKETEKAAKAITLMGGTLEEIRDVSTHSLPNRRIFVIRKTAPSPAQYPRNPGIPTKTPIT